MTGRRVRRGYRQRISHYRASWYVPRYRRVISKVEIFWLVMGFCLIAISPMVLYGYILGVTEASDYGSYAFPILAAVVAGGAFFAGKKYLNESEYYYFSLVFLALGFICYIRAHKCSGPIGIIIIIAFCSCCLLGLGGECWLRKGAKNVADRKMRKRVIWEVLILLLVSGCYLRSHWGDAYKINGEYMCIYEK